MKHETVELTKAILKKQKTATIGSIDDERGKCGDAWYGKMSILEHTQIARLCGESLPMLHGIKFNDIKFSTATDSKTKHAIKK